MTLLIQAAARMRQLRGDERGQGLTEYALLLAGIVIVVGAAVIFLGDEISDILASIF